MDPNVKDVEIHSVKFWNVSFLPVFANPNLKNPTTSETPNGVGRLLHTFGRQCLRCKPPDIRRAMDPPRRCESWWQQPPTTQRLWLVVVTGKIFGNWFFVFNKHMKKTFQKSKILKAYTFGHLWRSKPSPASASWRMCSLDMDVHLNVHLNMFKPY